MTAAQKYRHNAVAHIAANSGDKNKNNKAAAPFVMVLSKCLTSFNKSFIFLVFTFLLLIHDVSWISDAKVRNVKKKKKKRKKS